MRLTADGVTVRSTVAVVGDPRLQITLLQHRDREAFLLDVLELQKKVDTLVTNVAALRTLVSAARDAAGQGSPGRGAADARATRVTALDSVLRIGPTAIRARLNGLAGDFNGSGVQQGSFHPPTRDHRVLLKRVREAYARADQELAALRK